MQFVWDAFRTLGNWGTVALGLGFVIFIHELGHFLLAKWNDVKVEKFSIGFGPAIFKFRRGETEYALSIIPLGGFVKMLGEGEEGSTEEKEELTDPRAYPNKSVGARMAIISAGVIMNIFLGFACFVFAYGQGGLHVPPAVIGGVAPGSPAYSGGLRAGDEVVAINGYRKIDFVTMKRMTAFSGAGEVLHLEIKRPGRKDPLPLDIEPRREPGAEMKTMGIIPADDVVIAEPPYVAPPGVLDSAALKVPLKSGDRIVAVGPEGGEAVPISNAHGLYALLARYRNQPLEVVLERTSGTGTEVKTTTLHAVVPPARFVDFGFRLAHEGILAVRADSPAGRAGFRAGDRILTVDGDRDFDPMRLPDYCYTHAGQTVTFEVSRGTTGRSETLTLVATPDDTPLWVEPPLGPALDVPGLGLAVKIGPRLVGVRAGSPAARAGLRPGEEIQKIGLPTQMKNRPWRVLELTGKKAVHWPGLFASIQQSPKRAVRFYMKGNQSPIEITPEADPSAFDPLRGVQVRTYLIELPSMGVAACIQRGLEDTRDTILEVYASLRSLVRGDISPTALVGPVGLANIASKTVEAGWVKFIHLLGLISLNLAVINFLPIPPLDGGQMTFLTAEKVRGRPLPERAQVVGMYAGLALVLGLMGFVLFHDVLRLFGT
jgi:regulator of sigma E protease